MGKVILLTGVAGFIGSHTADACLARGDKVIGLDNLNDYYDPARKQVNISEVKEKAFRNGYQDFFTFIKGDIRDEKLVRELIEAYQFEVVVHLAAMAGVRASIENPHVYYDVNVMGTLNLFDAVVNRKGGQATASSMPSFVFASTSSVYGKTKIIPFVEIDPCDRPLAPYAASKRGAELLGFSYHHLYRLPFTALRFFTVYGPRGRPDMMAYKVLNNIFFGRDVPLYNSGHMHRDWTYVGDIVKGILGAVDRPLGCEIINLGRGEPVLLDEFVSLIEELAGKRANLIPTPMLDADMAYTYADISKTRELLGYNPTVSVREGVTRFWEWYQDAVLGKNK